MIAQTNKNYKISGILANIIKVIDCQLLVKEIQSMNSIIHLNSLIIHSLIKLSQLFPKFLLKDIKIKLINSLVINIHNNLIESLLVGFIINYNLFFINQYHN
jgi:hypothetical protein